MKIGRALCSLLLWAFVFSALFAAEALDYAVLSLHSRAEALGNAVVAHNVGQGSIFVNPSNIITDRTFELVSSTGKMFEDYTKYSIGFSRQLADKNTYVGINYTGAEIEGIERVEKIGERPEVLYESSDSRSVLIATIAQRLNESLNLGVNMKYYRHQMFDQAATGVGLDAGLHYKLAPSITLGAAYRNLNNGKLVWTTGESDEIEKETQLGISFKINLLIWETYLNADNVYNSHNEVVKNYGAEIWLLKNILALRAGKNDQQLKFGLGLTLSNLFLDYVYSDHEDLAESHKISLGAYF